MVEGKLPRTQCKMYLLPISISNFIFLHTVKQNTQPFFVSAVPTPTLWAVLWLITSVKCFSLPYCVSAEKIKSHTADKILLLISLESGKWSTNEKNALM